MIKKNQILKQVENIRSGAVFFQPKLAVNQPNDVYEQEADRVADKVMRMKEPSTAKTFFSPGVQRKCADCEKEEKKAQRKESENAPGKAPDQTEKYISNLSGGRHLDNEERNFFESRMGYDFSKVQLHTDTEASQSAKDVNALAYTHGNNIVFGSGQYRPNAAEGKRLLAHELTHVIQQTATIGRKTIQRQTTPAVVWGFEVWRNMCGCIPEIDQRINDANDFRSIYAGCDVPANVTGNDVENCFDTAMPGTTVAASTAPGGAVTGPAPAATPCERIANHATLVHEHFHTRQAANYARRVGGSFYADWLSLANTPATRLATLRARYPAEHARFMALWNSGHEWAEGEVESYLWERRFLQDVKRALRGFCAT